MGFTYTFVSILEAIGSLTGNAEMGVMPLVSIIHFTEDYAPCYSKCVREVRCCCYIHHDSEHIDNISSIERREFTLLLKVFFYAGH